MYVCMYVCVYQCKCMYVCVGIQEVRRRDAEIIRIAQSIEELAAIFQELAKLVIDQVPPFPPPPLLPPLPPLHMIERMYVCMLVYLVRTVYVCMYVCMYV